MRPTPHESTPACFAPLHYVNVGAPPEGTPRAPGPSPARRRARTAALRRTTARPPAPSRLRGAAAWSRTRARPAGNASARPCARGQARQPHSRGSVDVLQQRGAAPGAMATTLEQFWHGMRPGRPAWQQIGARERGQAGGRGGMGRSAAGCGGQGPRLEHAKGRAWAACPAAGWRPPARPGRRPWRRGWSAAACGGRRGR